MSTALAGLLLLAPMAGEGIVTQRMPDWLAGAWTTPPSVADWTEEWWTPPRAGIMLGGSRTGKGEVLGFFEHMRIEMSDAGLRFCAMPQGRAGACFQAVSVTDRQIVFENTTNDYPTRIMYRKEPHGVSAEISGPGGARRQTWTFVPLAE